MLKNFLMKKYLRYSDEILSVWGMLMDKLSMEELGFFLYMEEMERQQREEQAAQDGEEDDGEDE